MTRTTPHLPRDEYDWLIRGGAGAAAGADAQTLAAYMVEAVLETRLGQCSGMSPERIGTVARYVAERKDEKPFASLLGEPLSSVEFVMDYVQFRFGGPSRTLTALTPPVVTVDGHAFRWGEPGYRDALCEEISHTVRAGWVTSEEIVIQLDDDSTIAISNRIDDAVGPESAHLQTDDGWWVWRPGDDFP